MDRVILHSDMNNFYASVECMLDRRLAGKPVAVAGDGENRHGVILAKNYEAKKYGIQTGEVVWQAKQKCPDLVVVLPHYDQYLKFSRLAKQIYSDYTDLIEPYGMDECWLDVTESARLFGGGERIANEIRRRMKSELGLTVSVGVSFCKIFSKLGSDMKKPDAVTVIPKDRFREIVWGLPASDLLGVGRSTQKVLFSMGIRTIGDLACAPPSLIGYKLGKCGLAVWEYANNGDHSRVTPADFEAPVKSVGHGVTTREDLQSNAEVYTVMLSLVQDVAKRLRSYEKRAGAIQIDVRDCDLHHRQWQCPLQMQTRSASLIAGAAFDLFLKNYAWEKPIRSLTVRAIDLHTETEPEQLDLFGDCLAVQKKELLEETVEDIRERYGKYALIPAILCADGGKLPTDREFEVNMPTGMVG